MPASLIQAVEREGIRIGRRIDGEVRYSAGDVEVVRTALRLLEFGLPVGDLLVLARDADDALRVSPCAPSTSSTTNVREPIRDTAGTDPQAAARTVEAFETLLPAVTSLCRTISVALLEEAERAASRP